MPVQLGSAHGEVRIGYDGSGIGQALTALGGLSNTLMAVGQTVDRFVIQPLVALGREVVGVAADFESQMAVLGIAARDAGLPMDQLHDAVLKVGGDTDLIGISASGAADAITNLYKAGLDTTEIFGDLGGYMEDQVGLGGALRSAIDLAAASDLNLAQASDAVAVAMATFGLEADQATSVADSFVQSADASVAEVGELVDAMVNVGPTAASFGWSLEDVNTALALLSERGIRGAEAGTSLKSMMTNLMRPTDDVQGALRELGISLYDAEGAMRSLPEILADLEKGLYGESTALVEVGGRTEEQQKELDRLTKMYINTAQSLADYEAGLKGAGLTEKARAKKIGDLRAEMDTQAAAIASLDEIEGETVRTTRKLTEEQRNQYVQMLAGTYGMKAMNTLLAEGEAGWAGMEEAIGQAATTQEVAQAKAKTFAGAMEALDGVMETIKITVGEAVLPTLNRLARTVADFASKHADEIAQFAGRVGDALERTVDWLGEKLPKAIGTASGFWEGTLLPAITTVWGFIQQNVVPILETVWNWLGQLLPVAIQILSDYWTGYLQPALASLGEQWVKIQPALAELWAWLQERVPQAIAGLSAAWEAVGKPMFVFFGKILSEYVIPFLADVAVWLMKNVPVAIDATAKFIQEQLIPTLQKVWVFIRDNVIPIFVKIWEWLSTNIPAAIKAVSGFWTGTLLPAIKGVWAFLDEYIFPYFAKLIELFVAIGSKIAEFVSAYWNNLLLPALQDVWQFISEKLQPVFDALFRWFNEDIKPIIETVADLIVDRLVKNWNILKEAFEKAKTDILDKIPLIFDDIKKAISGATEWIGNLIDSIGKIELPAWLQPGKKVKLEAGVDVDIPEEITPGSPTPLELGFRGIADAMRQLSAIEFPRLNATMQVAPAAMGVATAQPQGTRGSDMWNTGSPTVAINVERIGDDVDIETLAYRVAQAIRRRQKD